MISRRKLIAGVPSPPRLLAGCKDSLPPTYGSLFDLSNSLTFASHRLLLRNQPLVREFSRDKITIPFPAINTTNPGGRNTRVCWPEDSPNGDCQSEVWLQSRANLPLATLKRLPSQTK